MSIEEREILSIFGPGHSERGETVTVLSVGNEGAISHLSITMALLHLQSVGAQGLDCDSRPFGPSSHHNYLGT